MDINITTPALLFPAISLLMLAYTNRFLTIATIIRNLYDRYGSGPSQNLHGQIQNLRYRTYLIRNMQIFGVLSLLFCMVSMFSLFSGWMIGGKWAFAIALILMMVSMLISLRELFPWARWICCWRIWRSMRRLDSWLLVTKITDFKMRKGYD